MEGLFELTQCTLMALNLALLLELHMSKETVRCAALGVLVPEHPQKQLTQTLIVCIKPAFFPLIPDCEYPT